MTPFDYKPSYRRKLPHLHSPGATIFTTFRLVGSVPVSVLDDYRRQRLVKERQAEERNNSEADTEFYRQWFLKIDKILDKAESGPKWLGRPNVRSVVYEKLLEGDTEHYRLDAFSIMNNHVHTVFRPNLDEDSLSEIWVDDVPLLKSEQSTLAQIMQSWKGASARGCNQLLGWTGQFWDHESFDREIRGAKGFFRAVRYTLRNPVKARLVARPMDWPGNYISARLLEEPWGRALWEGTN